jgi:hypothetical protein
MSTPNETQFQCLVGQCYFSYFSAILVKINLILVSLGLDATCVRFLACGLMLFDNIKLNSMELLINKKARKLIFMLEMLFVNASMTGIRIVRQ